jgi:hypothetical protein
MHLKGRIDRKCSENLLSSQSISKDFLLSASGLKMIFATLCCLPSLSISEIVFSTVFAERFELKKLNTKTVTNAHFFKMFFDRMLIID